IRMIRRRRRMFAPAWLGRTCGRSDNAKIIEVFPSAAVLSETAADIQHASVHRYVTDCDSWARPRRNYTRCCRLAAAPPGADRAPDVVLPTHLGGIAHSGECGAGRPRRSGDVL